jgi:O-antigen ligase
MLVLEGIAISVGLGTAVAAIGRLALYLLLLWMLARRSSLAIEALTGGRNRWYLQWEWLVLLTVAYMASTILWTTVDWARGLWAWSEHARLVTIPAVFLLVRSRNEAQIVLRYFVFTQVFVVVSSWLLIADVAVPWALAEHAQRDYEVFGSYLEQSISEAVTAFVLWHQRSWILGAQRKWLAVMVAWSIVVHIVGFLPSRTGYLVTSALLCVALLAYFPRRWLVGGMLLAGAAMFAVLPAVMGSESIRAQRAPLIQRLINPQDQRERQISTDVRLAFWAASLKAMAEQPLLGSGSGSWNREYLRVTSVDIPTYRNIRDPHQMFLLWGVEGGAIGLFMLCATLLSMFATSRQFAAADALSLQAILLALVVAGLTTSTIYGIGLGDFFCVGIGLLLRLGASAHSTTNGDSCDTA